ncbi:MAG: 16S rRNA (adenine(1518)-N(6)/adenine(1519)-N(6))-dimethyltransferase RsmA [Candidatus Paceibacterota bacterium]
MNRKINKSLRKQRNNSENSEEIFGGQACPPLTEPTGDGRRAKKSLGQNFLTSKRIVERIVMEGRVTETDTVLEIGPGKGILTEALLAKAKKVLAVEKDDSLFEFLKEKFSKEIKQDKLELIHSDILTLNFTNLELRTGDYKVIANIPYNITGEIIRKFLSSNIQPASMTLLVQKEVAERIAAKDGKESILSLSVKVYGTPRLGFKISRGQFTPAPNVDSMVISIDNISKENFACPPLTEPTGDGRREEGKIKEEKFFEVVKLGFAHKRKLLIRNLDGIASKEKLAEIFAEAKISALTRAETLKLKDWLYISKKL